MTPITGWYCNNISMKEIVIENWMFTDRSIRARWLSGRASYSRLRYPCQTLGMWFHSILLSSLSCMNEKLAIDRGGYLYEHPSRSNCSVASQRS